MSYIYYINVLLSSIINQTNKNVALIPKQARDSHPTGTGARMDHMMHLTYLSFLYLSRERSGSVVECLTRDGRAAGSSLTGVTALWSLSKTHLS